MSATDARYEDSATYDDEKKSDQDSDARDSVLNDGPVLLPVDSEPERTEGTSSDLPDHDPTSVVESDELAEDADRDRPLLVGGEVKDLDDDPDRDDAGDVKNLDDNQINDTSTDGKDDPDRTTFATDSTGTTTDLTPDGDDVITPDGDDVVTDDDVITDDTAATVGPDTETGALKDPVPAVTSADAEPASTTAATTTTAAPVTGSPSSTDLSAEWLELQGKFVDDPAAAVKEAGAKVEAALSELRAKIESGSTEDLRTAFRRYRELHAGLS